MPCKAGYQFFLALAVPPEHPIAGKVRLIVEKKAAGSGLAFADVRYQSICRWNLLVKQG